MHKIPLIEKYKHCNDVDVIKIENYEFVIKEINHIQANYLYTFTEYFFSNPESFIPFLYEIIINTEELERFLNDSKVLNGIQRKKEYQNKILNLINAICIQCLSISPMSFDYTFSNEIKNIQDNNLIINRFITILINYGYKKNEINNFSNKKIIKLALEELWIRSKSDCIIFIGEIISDVKAYKKKLPISYDEFNKLFETWKDRMIFSSEQEKHEEAKFEFINTIKELFSEEQQINNSTYNNEDRKQSVSYSKKSLAELKAEKQEAERQRNLLKSL